MMVEVTDEDRNFRTAILKHIIETLDRPCSDGDMIDDRNDAFDLFLARHRIAAEQRGKLEGARLAIEAAAVELERQDGFGEWFEAANHIRALSPAKIVGEG